MAGNGATAYFDRDDGRQTLGETQQQDAKDVEVGALIFRSLAHVGTERADEPVAEQDAEKSSHQRGGDFVADELRRAAQGAHGDDDSEDRGDDAEAGERVGHGGERTDALVGVVVLRHPYRVPSSGRCRMDRRRR